MPDNTQSTNDNPQDVIDQVLGGGEEPKEEDVGEDLEKKIDVPKPEIKIPEKEEQKYEAPKMPAELITPPATPIPAEPGKPEVAPPPPVAPPKPLPTQSQTPKPEIPVKEPVPLAFAGAAPTPGVAPELGGISESGKVSPATAPSVAPAGVKSSKMVEPKKKGGKKALKVIAGLVILLVTVVGGLYGYMMYYAAEAPTIARYNPDALIRQRERNGGCEGAACLAPEIKKMKEAPADSYQAQYLKEIEETAKVGNTSYNTLAISDLVDIASGKKKVGGNNTSTVDNGVQYCNQYGGSNCDTTAGVSAFLKTANINLYNEYQRTLESQGSASSDLSIEDQAIANLCNSNSNKDKVVGFDDWPSDFSVSDGRVTAIDCRINVSGKFVGKAYYDSTGKAVSEGDDCAGKTRTSDGESYQGGFVGCEGKRNCFCSGDVAVGDPYTSGTVFCETDYANDSCGADTPSGSYTVKTLESDEPPVTPVETTPTLACTSLTKDLTDNEIELGDELVFTCAGSVVPAGATTLAYDFRYRRDAGEWFDLTATGQNTIFTVAMAGTYEVQCRACGTISNASVCDPSWIGAGL